MQKEVSSLDYRIAKWGDSLALLIPQPLASEIGLELDTEVELTSRGQELVVTVRKRSNSKLDMLLEGITEENLHAEVDTEQRVGNETW